MMKKVLVAIVLMGAVEVATAATVAITGGGGALCTGTGGTGTVTTTAGNFVKNGFTVTCSNNVHLVGIEDTLKAGVAAGSSKGKNIFGGYTEGGGVKAMATNCLTDGCSAAEVLGQADEALAGSS